VILLLEIKEFLAADLLSENLQPLNEKKRKDLLRSIENLLSQVHSVNPSLRPRMNTPSQPGPKPPLSKPPIKTPETSFVPQASPPEEEDDPQEEYLPMQPGFSEIEPEDYEAPGDVVMPDGTTLGNGGAIPEQDELYEELPAEDGPQDDDMIEPEDYEDPAVAGSLTNLNQVPLPPKPSTRAASTAFEEPGYQPTGKPAEENTDGMGNIEPWQYAKTMKDKKVSTTDLKNADCKGMLEKLGGRGHNTWQKRYCVLDTSLLYFFKDDKSKNFNNFIEAHAYSVSQAPDKTKEKKNQFCFVLTCRQSGKDYYFRTTSFEDRERWMNALKNCVPSQNLPSSMHISGSMNTIKPRKTVEQPTAEEFQSECYEDVPALNDRIPFENESDEEGFESQRQPKQTVPPVMPKMPLPPPPAHPTETFEQDQLYDEHPVDEPEEEYLACETSLQQDIIKSASPPPLPEIIVDTNRIYEAVEGGVDLESIYVSLYSFTAEEDDEITLQRGDLVTVLDSVSSSDWWLAELVTGDIVKTNKQGYCPANILTVAFQQV